MNAPAAPAEFDETTGGIEGFVVDDELGPVPAAQVGILALELQTLTDAEGKFSLSHVPPGEHELIVVAIGFETTREPVMVDVGGITTPEITLNAIAVLESYTIVQIQRGLFGCGSSGRVTDVGAGLAACGVFGIADDVAGTNTTAYDDFLLLWPVDNSTNGGWTASVFEMSWDSNQVAGKGLDMIWEIEGCPNENSVTFWEGGGRSVLRGNASLATINDVLEEAKGDDCEGADERCNADTCLIWSRVFSEPDTLGAAAPLDVGFTFQQSFEQVHTIFYHTPEPETYTAYEA